MTRKRKIKSWGSSLALSIPGKDAIDLDIGRDDIVDLSTMQVIEKHNGKKPKDLTDALERLRKVSKWGPTYAIMIPQYDAKDLNLEEGDIVDLDKLKIVERVHSEENGK